MKKVICNYCGGIMTLINESYPDYPELQRYYECFDCGQCVPLSYGYDEEHYIDREDNYYENSTH